MHKEWIDFKGNSTVCGDCAELTESYCDSCAWDYGHMYDDDEDAIRFADPTGRSALRAATEQNPRNLPCPTCHRPDMLTPADRSLGYQCDICADRAEQGLNY